MKMNFKHIFIFIFCFATAISLSAQTEAELRKRKAETEKEIENINKKLGETTSAKKDKTIQISLLNSRISQRKKLIKNTDIQISLTENEIVNKDTDIKKLKSDIDKLKEYYSELLINYYTKRKKNTWMMYVFASEDFGQAYRRLKYIQSYSDVVHMQAGKIKNKSELLSSEVLQLNKRKGELDAYKNERKRDLEKLSVDENAAKLALRGLSSEEVRLKNQIAQKRQAVMRMNAEIEKLLRSAMQKTSVSNYMSAPENVALSANFANNRGRLPWPVQKGNITGFFGRHFHPVFKNIELPPNNGIDISTNSGESVLSVFDGVVRNVFSIPGMNVCIMLQHGEYFTVYARLKSSAVKVGDKVKTGTKIGTVFGGENAAQLHFELWKEKSKMNPELWLLKK